MARPTKREAPRQDRTHSTILACPQRRPHSRPQCRIVRRLSQRRGRIQHLRTTRLRNRPARADPKVRQVPRARTRDPTPTASCDKFQPCRRPDDETGRAQGRSSLRRLYARLHRLRPGAGTFNSLDNQREASEAYIKSQAHEGWKLVRERYDDGGFSGGSMERPALQKLLDDVRARKIDVIVVYKVDRLTRSLADFAKLVELFDAHGVSF